MSFGGQAPPASVRPNLRSLSSPADSSAVAGTDVEVKEEGKGGGRKAKKKGKGSKLCTHEVFYAHLARSLIQPPICVTNCPARNGR